MSHERIRLLKGGPQATPDLNPRQMQREVRIAQLVRMYPTLRVRNELNELVKRLEVSETGNGQLIANFSQFSLCYLDWQGPSEEFILDNTE